MLAVVFALALPAAAGATIVVNEGMFGVNLGATMKQVRHKLGAPNVVDHRGGTTNWFYARRQLLLRFGSNSRRLRDIFTENPKQRTARGVGIGSTQNDVMRLVPGVQCSSSASGTDCIVLSHRSGHVRGTDFHVATNGRVDDVGIDVIR